MSFYYTYVPRYDPEPPKAVVPKAAPNPWVASPPSPAFFVHKPPPITLPEQSSASNFANNHNCIGRPRPAPAALLLPCSTDPRVGQAQFLVRSDQSRSRRQSQSGSGSQSQGRSRRQGQSRSSSSSSSSPATTAVLLP